MSLAGTLDIGEVARRSGLPVSTLRYYEEKGLVRSVGRNGLRRLFDGNVMQKLDFIALGRRAGFSLDEIAAMFGPDGRLQVDRDQLEIKAGEIDRQIRQMTAIRDGLRHAAKCSAPSHLECPTFQRFMQAAGKSEAKRRR